MNLDLKSDSPGFKPRPCRLWGLEQGPSIPGPQFPTCMRGMVREHLPEGQLRESSHIYRQSAWRSWAAEIIAPSSLPRVSTEAA